MAISCLDPSCHHNKDTTLPPITPYFVMRVGKLPLALVPTHPDRMGGIACWNAVMDENVYMVQKWNEFVAA